MAAVAVWWAGSIDTLLFGAGYDAELYRIMFLLHKSLPCPSLTPGDKFWKSSWLIKTVYC
jgi:hypothetical protein